MIPGMVLPKMKRAVALFLCAATLVACGGKETQRIVLDDSHNALSPATAGGVPRYPVRPGPRYVLDASAYSLEPPAGAPPTVHRANYVTIASHTGMYAFEWPAGASQAFLDASGAAPLGNSPPFRGFTPGETVTMMVGYRQPTVVSGKLTVFPYWMGQVEVGQQ